MTQYSLGLVGLITGLLIGTNPVLISTFVMYIKSMVGRGVPNTRYTVAGLLFLFYFGLFVLFFATIITSFLLWLDPAYQFTIMIGFSIVAIIYGASQIRRYFWRGPIIQPPKRVASILHDKATKNGGLTNVLALALVTAYATVPILGIVLILMASFSVIVGPSALIWGLPFVLGLLTPLYVILALLSNGTKPSVIISWKESTKGTMRLYNGLTVIAITWLLLVLLAGQGVISI